MAIVVASREAAIFLKHICFRCIEIMGEIMWGKEKCCIHSVLKSSPGRWTGNKPIFKGGLKSVILRLSQVFVERLINKFIILCCCRCPSS